MKFEIDDKTGMIFDISENLHSYYYGNNTANALQLEQILQAVKKTQEKRVNKQIQEISEDLSGTFIKKTEKIEQNQKIVDGIELIIKTAITQRKRLELLPDTRDKSLQEISDRELLRTNILINGLTPLWHHVTGKDIKELLRDVH